MSKISLLACGIKRELTTYQLVHNKTSSCIRFVRSKNEKGGSYSLDASPGNQGGIIQLNAKRDGETTGSPLGQTKIKTEAS
jgi:hypothetical protein